MNLHRGNTLTISYGSAISRDNEATLKVRSRNKVMKGKIDKITFENVANPKGVRYYAYERGNGVWSFTIGDMAICNVKIKRTNDD